MTQLRVLFLDDDPERAVRFSKVCPDSVWVKTAEECERWLAKSIPWDLVCLDHDLDQDMGGRNSGATVVQWLADNPQLLPPIVVHSWNVPNGEVMTANLNALGYEARHMPFGQKCLGIIKQWVKTQRWAVPPGGMPE